MKNVLVIGSEGQLGNEIKCLSSEFDNIDFIFTTIEELDITDTKRLEATIRQEAFDYIINCTAYTAVDKAESETELANAINHLALQTIGKSAFEQKSKVIHVSTDYVFDGQNHKPYTEEDKPSPNSVYGKTKLDGEKALMMNNPESIIIRTSWLYSSFGHNFVKTMLQLGKNKDELNVIFDQIGTPTYAKDLAEVILEIIQKDINLSIPFNKGIYHYSNEGVCSWYDFTKAIHELSAINCSVHPIETKDYPTDAPRPQYSVMNKAKIKTIYKINIPHWRESLQECLSRIN